MATAMMATIVQIVAMEGAGWVAAGLGAMTAVAGIFVVIKGAIQEATMVKAVAETLAVEAKEARENAEETADAQESEMAEGGMALDVVTVAVEASDNGEAGEVAV